MCGESMTMQCRKLHCNVHVIQTMVQVTTAILWSDAQAPGRAELWGGGSCSALCNVEMMTSYVVFMQNLLNFRFGTRAKLRLYTLRTCISMIIFVCRQDSLMVAITNFVYFTFCIVFVA